MSGNTSVNAGEGFKRTFQKVNVPSLVAERAMWEHFEGYMLIGLALHVQVRVRLLQFLAARNN